jgi:hypothetical protein
MLKYCHLLLSSLVLFAVPGCVELAGQRISCSYDAAKDQLQVILFYDGVHDSGSDVEGKGAEQLPKFIEHGDFMVLDWMFHFDRTLLEVAANKPNISKEDLEFCRACLAIRAEPIGYYREPDGRLGAAQRLTIPAAKKVLAGLNRLIGKMQLDSVRSAMPRTAEKFRAASAAGHAWISLDGNSIRVALPVDPEEWSRVKADALEHLVKSVSGKLEGKDDDDQRRGALNVIRLLSSGPISYIDEGERVEFRIGLRDKPLTLKFDLRGKCDASLEQVLKKAVPKDFDEAAAKSLLGVKPASPDVDAALKALPETGVGALLAWAERGDDKQKDEVVVALNAWGKQWNGEHRLPAAPAPAASREKSLIAWKTWYMQARQFPMIDPRAKPAAK